MAGLRQGSKAEIRTREEKSLHSSFRVTRLPSTDKSIFFQVVFSGCKGFFDFFFFLFLSMLISSQAEQAGKPSCLLKGFANVLRENILDGPPSQQLSNDEPR